MPLAGDICVLLGRVSLRVTSHPRPPFSNQLLNDQSEPALATATTSLWADVLVEETENKTDAQRKQVQKIRQRRVLWDELHCPKFMLESYPPVPQNVAIFGYTVFTEVIKGERGHWGGSSPQRMGGLTRRGEPDTYIH